MLRLLYAESTIFDPRQENSANELQRDPEHPIFSIGCPAAMARFIAGTFFLRDLKSDRRVVGE